METEAISIPLAFMAGFLSFASPCVLPLVPVYLGYLTGTTLAGDDVPRRWVLFGHAALFVSGFTLVFVAVFGTAGGLLGSVLSDFADVLVQVGGLFLVLFGLHMGGFFRWLAGATGNGLLQKVNNTLDSIILPERKLKIEEEGSPGYARSFFVGMTFAAGWTPCIGPLLSAILALAIQGQNLAAAFLFLFIYSMGLAVPFMAAALLLSSATGLLRKLNRHMHAIEVASSLFLVAIGLLLLTGEIATLNRYASRFVPEWLIERL